MLFGVEIDQLGTDAVAGTVQVKSNDRVDHRFGARRAIPVMQALHAAITQPKVSCAVRVPPAIGRAVPVKLIVGGKGFIVKMAGVVVDGGWVSLKLA